MRSPVDTCDLPRVMNGDIKKIASHRLLCCVPTLYVHMCCFINVKSKHDERLIFDRLFVRVFLRQLNFPKS